ncbi:ScbA/BarX family gamma-butyrolactone biosynthesis protein [Streptomyces sp. NPDC005244]|uniref:ScbA/BarX family gamma-butyrolactone biosynthesis protein n=1 Tax=Streptomyces sp. NPDC005244 TaxID=3364708 RepID=UPI0036CDF903
MTIIGALAPRPTLPRQYVHKESQSEVLLASWEPLGADCFRITAQWPRAHYFYDVVNGQHDPLLLVETVRQAVPVLSHLGYDAPFGHRQIWNHLAWSIDPAALTSCVTPAEIDMHIRCTDVLRRGNNLTAATMNIELLRDGRRLGNATTRFTNQSPVIYERLRGDRADLTASMASCLPAPAPVEPLRVGRDRRRDVVLAPTSHPNVFRLRVDTNHPALFDHPVDHVPGMLVVEAARQTGHAVAHPDFAVITGMEASFRRYVELDTPCWIEATPLESGPGELISFGVTATQLNETVFDATVTALRGPLAAETLEQG